MNIPHLIDVSVENTSRKINDEDNPEFHGGTRNTRKNNIPSEEIEQFRTVLLVGIQQSQLMSIKTLFNGRSAIPTLIASGAQRSLMHESVLRQIGYMNKIDEHRIFKIKALGEDQCVKSIGCAELEMCIGILKFKVTFVVIPEHIVLSNVVVLGYDFLKSNNGEIEMKNRRVTKNCSNGTKVYLYVKGNHITRSCIRDVKCVATEAAKIEANDHIILPYKYEMPEELMGEENETGTLYLLEGLPQKEATAVTGIVDLDCPLVMVQNKDVAVKQISKGQVAIGPNGNCGGT